MPWGRHWGGEGALPGPAGGYPARGVPCLGGVPCPGVPCWGGYPARGVPWSGTPQPGQDGGGYPARSSWGGTLPGGQYPAWGVPCWGGTLVRYPPWPGQEGGGATLPGGTLVRYPPSQDRMGGGTQVGQQKEYSIHGGRYASCVHAGGLSCLM